MVVIFYGIDPVLGEVRPIWLWRYGLAYVIGLVTVDLSVWLKREYLVVPRAWRRIALGRIGSHINGEVWAREFPYAEGCRHPVALYVGSKNPCMCPHFSISGDPTSGGMGIFRGDFC